MRNIVIIAHDIRSCHNVGSLLRTAEGLGIEKVYLTGYTPYPQTDYDSRLPHVAQKIDKQISKTALGAERMLPWEHADEVLPLLSGLRTDGYEIVGLEQAPHSIALPEYMPPEKLAILLGREVEGIDRQLLDICDLIVEIPMKGKKESFNVVQSAAIAMYHCVYS